MKELQAFADNKGELHRTKRDALEADFKDAACRCGDDWFRFPSGHVRQPEEVISELCSDHVKFHAFFGDLLSVEGAHFALTLAEISVPKTHDIKDSD